MGIKTDVLIPTYNSGKYFDECLYWVTKTVPYNRIIVADHQSTDDTLEIAKRYGCEIYDDGGKTLAAARNLLISKASTPIITWIDSDIVIREKYWWWRTYKTLVSSNGIGAVVARVSEEKFLSERMKYAHFWWKVAPGTRKFGMTLGSTLMRLDDVRDIRIPEILDAREDRYLEVQLLKRGKKIEFIFVNGTHYFDYQEDKAYWSGANTRIISNLIDDPDVKQTSILYFLFRRILPAPFKAIPPALYYRDPKIIMWNTRHWWKFLMGWLYPQRYRKIRRGEK